MGYHRRMNRSPRSFRRRWTACCFGVLAASSFTPCASGEATVGAQLAPLSEFLEAEEKLYSQFAEELIIRHHFGDRRDGVFLDVGCGPARRNSTTFYLEEQLGWSGIGVDALPDWQPGYDEHRPQTRYRQFIVTDHSGSVESFYRVLRGKQRSSVEEQENLPQETIEVETVTLNDLLEREGIESIDFLSMDIEGSAPPALAGFDIRRFAPALVCIEAAQNEGDYQKKLVKYFKKNGYERVEEYLTHDRVNWYFAPKRP